ncbi:MAG: isoprenylcysteine carboxylmethyltransferase family protein [Candidatus Krumholzibacteria bacterium]|nr:isoprenylcysteine carboxylmethyltransferase family protein [Candidatus Krumholzibacteria bacterium]
MTSAAPAKRPLPPTYFLIALLAMVALHLFAPGPRLIGSLWRLAGVALIAIGVGLNLWADGLFKTHGTEVKPFRESSALVIEGPFRFSRNPMYAGMLAVLAGAAVLAGTLTPFFVVIITAWLLTAHFVIPEERHMEEQFGEPYRAYKSRVRRWL